MHIWILTPIDINHRNWARSDYKGEVIVRAENEKQARTLARREFSIAYNAPPGELIKSSPWDDRAATKCDQANDSAYSEVGPAQVLKPARIK